MRATESVDTVMLGAGPAGLAAGCTLARAERRPVVIKKGKVAGELMRSIKRGEFIVDVGRKELYRLAKVDAFLGTRLGDEYRSYPTAAASCSTATSWKSRRSSAGSAAACRRACSRDVPGTS